MDSQSPSLSQWQKMLSGQLYDASDPELTAARAFARGLLLEINASSGKDRAFREPLLRRLFGTVGGNPGIEPPFYCDYGKNIHLGRDVYFNFNCVVLDVATVEIGDRTLFGPAVQIYTATHPMDSAVRAKGLEAGKPIRIGSDVWVGGAAVILPGVTIGSRSVIGAGSVVTRDIPEGVLAVGNPCRVIRKISERL